MQKEVKKLYRSENNSLVAGVIGGIGEYFDVDPTILRLCFIVLVLLTGIFPGVIAYIIAYFIIPDRPRGISLLKNNPPITTPPPVSKPTPAPSPKPENVEDIETPTIDSLLDERGLDLDDLIDE